MPLRVKIYLPVEGPYQLDHLLACDEIGPQCLSESTHVRLGNSDVSFEQQGDTYLPYLKHSLKPQLWFADSSRPEARQSAVLIN